MKKPLKLLNMKMNSCLFVAFLTAGCLFTPVLHGADRIGSTAKKIMELQAKATRFTEVNPFSVSASAASQKVGLSVARYTMLDLNETVTGNILASRPSFLRVSVPGTTNGFSVLLYKVDISPSGFQLLTSDGKSYQELNAVVHYRGMIEGDPYSVAAFSFSMEETMGMICNDDGNYVVGKIDDPNVDEYLFYNDKDLMRQLNYTCGTNTEVNAELYYQDMNKLPESTSVNCVNWYYEIDYDIFVGKGSVANVNSYIQGAFNQVATLYDNDGISIALQTIYVWTSTDPYTGPTTSNYLSQFGAYRTSFTGDLANLVGYSGGGGIAYINGICASSPAYRMGYMGINSSYNTVPTYSWTVEVITHEDGHLLGSRHTHDCVWNGNNTRIDGCGPQAGYAGSGSCASAPLPSSGTIMSYCHLVSGVGINFNNGFGPQPATLILNNVNNSSCLAACTSCPTPPQPGSITGATTYCGSVSQTYSIIPVGGATSYSWTLPNGWSGTSTTNSITVTTSGSGGTLSVIAINSCGNSSARTLTVTGNTAPSQPGNLIGNTAVCQGVSQTYSITAVSGATSYTWSLPPGWTGSSITNSISAVPSANSGNVTVSAVNGCGTSAQRTLSVSSGSAPQQPLSISGDAVVCPGTSFSYSVPVVSGANSYIWTFPPGWSGTSSTNSITVISGSVAGDISVSANNGCGTSAASTLSTQIAAVPSKPNTISTSGGNVKVCPGDVKTYFISPVSGATGYTWYAPNGASITSGQGTLSVVVTYSSQFVAHDSIKVVANNGCAISDVRFLRIFRNTPGKPGTITGPNANACGTTGIVYSVNNVPGMIYQWNFSQSGAVISSGQGTNSITANFGSTLSSGLLSVTAANACGVSNARTLAIVDEPSQPDLISGTNGPCVNEQGVPYSISPVAGATSYTWKVPSGARIHDGNIISTTTTLTTTSNAVTVNFKNYDGNVKVRANNLCGSGAYRTMPVTFACRELGQAESVAQSDYLYPNPAATFFEVHTNTEHGGEWTVTVKDLTGKTLLIQTLDVAMGQQKMNIDVSAITSGIYMVESNCNNRFSTSKLVIQK